MIEVKLEPCPLCGSEPYTRITETKDGEMNGYIRCNNTNCGLQINFKIKSQNGMFLSFNDIINGLKKEIEKWNRRVQK